MKLLCTPRCTVCGHRVPLNSPHTVRCVATGNVIARFCSAACVRERTRQNDTLDVIDPDTHPTER